MANSLLAPLSQKKSCHTSLYLMLDASGSLNEGDWRKQVEGTVKALADPEFAWVMKERGPIAIAAGKFSDNPKTLVPFTVIKNREDAIAFGEALKEAGATFDDGPSTNIDRALLHAAAQIKGTPCPESWNRVVDISTDGQATSAPSAKEASNALYTLGIRVNGLAVGAQASLDSLKQHVITENGFAEKTDWDNYGIALRDKIVRETSALEKPTRTR